MVIRTKNSEVVWLSGPIFMSPESTWDKEYNQFSPHNYVWLKSEFYIVLKKIEL
jgi:hypothetical protein